MPSPLTDFEQNFRTSETLLKVYRLLESPDGPHTEHRLMQNVRELLMARQEEELILLINDLFLGVVRANADIKPGVFKTDNLSLLLRQAVVAGCSALDVYFPTLLKAYFIQLIDVRERNFIPAKGPVRDFFKDFTISIENTIRMITDERPNYVLRELWSEYLKRKTLSNSQGVDVTIMLFGVEDPWAQISNRLGLNRELAFRQFNELVNRRNDIVHRGDHSALDPNGAIQQIQHSWADAHIRFARSVVLACDELVREQLQAFGIPLEVAEIPQPANPGTAIPQLGNPESADSKPTNPELTNQEPINAELAKPELTNPELAIPEPANPEPANPEPANPETVIPEPANPELAAPKPSNPEPANPDSQSKPNRSRA